MNNDNKLEFKPSFFGSGDLDSITEDDIKVSTQEDTNIKEEESKEETPDENAFVDKDQTSEERIEIESDENTEKEPDVDDLTPAQAFIELLNQEGLQIYNEIPKDLTMEQFVKDIPEYISSLEEEIRRDEASKLGKFQEYYDLMFNQKADPEDLKPAMVLERTASLDLNDKSITSDDLINVIKTKHLLRGLNEEEATALAGLSAKDINKLKEEAFNSQEFIISKIDNIKKEVALSKELEIKSAEESLRLEQESFINALNTLDLTKNQKEEFFNIRYKRDQQIIYTDADGIKQRDFVTRFDILTHELFSNPAKLIAYIDFINSAGSETNLAKNSVKDSYSKKLLDKLEGRSQIKNTKVSNNNNFKQSNEKSEQNKQSFEPLIF